MFSLISFSALIGAVAILVGLGAIFFPLKSSLGFGIAASPGHTAYVSATGARDVFIGLIFIYFYQVSNQSALSVICFFTAFVSIVDFFLTYRFGRKLNSLVHLAATLTLIGYGLMLARV